MFKKIAATLGLIVVAGGGALIIQKGGDSLSQISPSTQLAQVATSNQVGYWNFDDGSVKGQIGNAKDFKNTSFNTGSDFIGSGDVTVCAWINPRSLRTGNYTPNIVSNGAFAIYLFGQSPYSVGVTSNGGGKYPSTSGIPARTWSHVCVTRTSKGSASFYINGSLKSTADSGIPTKGYNNLIIGNRIQGGQDFDGLMDEVRIYNKVLSSTEVAAVYAYKGDRTTPPPLTISAISAAAQTNSSERSPSSVTITWTTNIAADSLIEYGPTTSYGSSVTDAAVVTSHSKLISGLSPNSTYHYRIKAPANSRGQAVSEDKTFITPPSSTIPDRFPPSTPTSLVAVQPDDFITEVSADLAWGKSADAVITGQTSSGLAGYKIYRNGIQIATSVLTMYLDTRLTPGTTYSYAVSAYDNAGNESPRTPVLSLTTLPPSGDTTPPPMTTNFRAGADSSTQVSLWWNDTFASEHTIYKIYRNGVQINTVSSGVIVGTEYPNGPRGAPLFLYHHIDTAYTGLMPGTTYTYTMATYDMAGNSSGQTPPSSVTTPSN